MNVRIADTDDLARLCEISKECLPEAFSEANFKSSFNNSFEAVLVCTEKEICVGYCDFTFVSGEGELLQIVVAPEFRGKGAGRLLFENMLLFLQGTETKTLFLEVRRSNEAAKSLYQSFGMKEVGERRGFYENPKEDALIYRLDL